MAKVPVQQVAVQYTTLLKELHLLPAEKAANKAAHDATFEKAREIVSKAILETNEVESRKQLIETLRSAESAFRKKNATFKVDDPLSTYCRTVDQEGNLTPFKGQNWWKQYETPTDNEVVDKNQATE